ncbi:ran-binding protein 9 [Neodiprion fabricii]|uniref:ran-binding protein 9 n=1 Tax=Neodiprion fabricii TaxID=2872261 RepID=UPI001ED951D2|nr:ran-binding protein 9 [Neodiprion fabricii]
MFEIQKSSNLSARTCGSSDSWPACLVEQQGELVVGLRMTKMAATSEERSAMEPSGTNSGQSQPTDRLKMLYPMVNEEETPLPRSWSPKDKFNYIGLSQNNLRVHYKGYGKTHKDAASVRTMHSIPAACGLYYFEVKIVSKGRDGYMGIGLSAHGVNVNRLPGWDKNSYGYHGDDGHSFCSSGTGQPYGPTFTTGDVIGCGVNLVDNTAFYTKNGHHLGIAFTDLPPNLYPTVGLQTPGEIVDANFGQAPFVFDIGDMINELRVRTRLQIIDYPTPDHGQGQWQSVLHKMVSTYLVHHGYCATAEAFANSTGQVFEEEINSIKNRQRILKLVLAGRMGEAIELTTRLYPGLLDRDPNLMFALKCRQFVEMVNGSDSEVCQTSGSENQTSVIQSTKAYNTKTSTNGSVEEMNLNNTLNGAGDQQIINGQIEDDVDMEENSPNGINGVKTGNGYQNGDLNTNGHKCENGGFEDMEVDNSNQNQQQNGSSSNNVDNPSSKSNKKLLCGGNKQAVEKMLEFGRQLYSQSIHLRQQHGKNDANKKMLQDAFSLLAYSNPWSSPVGWQLNSQQRETVCDRLNSAILESSNLPRRPPLEVAVSHARELVRLMSSAGLGACGFAVVDNIVQY